MPRLSGSCRDISAPVAGRRSPVAVVSQTELRMGSEAHESKGLGVGLLVDEDQVGLDVAVSVVAPVAAQGVVVMPAAEGPVGGQGFHDGHQDSV